jgi:hypothetical protein
MTMDVSSAFRFVIGRMTRAALLAAALIPLLATSALAQDAGVSGIPPGPGNANGLNGSIRDPAGIGNAARMPSLPQPDIRPVTPTTVAPLNATRPTLRQGSTRVGAVSPRRMHSASSRTRRSAERAAVKENDRLLNHRITSICRGC